MAEKGDPVSDSGVTGLGGGRAHAGARGPSPGLAPAHISGVTLCRSARGLCFLIQELGGTRPASETDETRQLEKRPQPQIWEKS